ncbi:uncharacterized protein LOC134275434 [Saccostrea cucullata]|uniref:uncharacterized protein LOC134275434 n=1 Tax=Saccostrea cuccullata TaxID=36930 RepID=UPI002ED2C6CE
MYYRARNNKTRIELYVEETVPFYNLDDFRRFFRVSRATFECLCRNIAHFQQLQPGWTGEREFISTDKHLLISLWYLATQDSIHSISDRFNVTESSVIRCRTRITDIFVNHLKQVFITLPSANEHQEIMDKFEQKQNFPGVLGALDRTHIAIKAPKSHPETYVNRTGFYSIFLQGICREDLRFIHCIAGWPGSCHDARVLKNTYIWENGLAVCGNGHFLEDGAYPLRSWLLTPYRDTGHLTPQQRNYNYRHSGTRVTIERAFGCLKGRFRRLRYLETLELKTSVEIIILCCIIHNICILNNDDVQEFFEDNQQGLNVPQCNLVDNQAEGLRKRDNIAQNLP